MNTRLLKSFLSGMDESDVREVADEVDMEEVLRQIGPMLDDQLQPHFDDIRERAQHEDVIGTREYYRNLSPQEQQEQFEATMADLIRVLRLCREKPDEGFPMLKSRLRDPDVTESLLLIFHNEQNINPAYTKEIKQFSRDMIKWAGASVFPEMYTQSELDDIERRLAGE